MKICIREPLLYNIAAKQNIHKGSLMLKELNTLLEKIPVWKELVGLPKRVQELEQKVKDLESQLEKPIKKGVECPYCNETNTKLLKIYPHPVMPEFMDKKSYQCNECNQTFERDSNRSM